MNHPKESCDLFNFGFRAVLNFKTGEAMHLKFITGIIMTYHASVMLVFCSPCVPCVTSERYLMLLMTQKLFSNSKNDFRTVYIYETMMLKMSLYSDCTCIYYAMAFVPRCVCVCVCVCDQGYESYALRCSWTSSVWWELVSWYFDLMHLLISLKILPLKFCIECN